MASLENVKLKIGWATHHYNLLCFEIARYLKDNPPKFVIKRESATHTEAWGAFIESAPVPQDVSLMLGDILQTAHSSLDYLVCELIRKAGEEPVISNQFVIANDRASFEDEIGRKRLKNVPFAAITTMERLQPYNTGKNPIQSPLFALKTLTNIHKHRNLLITALGASKAAPDMDVIEVDGAVYTNNCHPIFEKPFDLNAEVGPFAISGANVHMEDTYAAFVVLAETSYKGRELMSLIAWICLSIRDTLIPHFEGFF